MSCSILNSEFIVARARLGDGAERLTTCLLWPDGTNVEVFVETIRHGSRLAVTDHGQTAEWLASAGLAPWKDGRRKELFSTAAESMRCELTGVAIETQCHPEELADAVLRLSQASLRAADLIVLRKTLRNARFPERVSRLLAGNRIAFRENERVGPKGQAVLADILVPRNSEGRPPTIIMAVGGKDKASVHRIAVERFARLTDLGKLKKAAIEFDARWLTVYEDSPRLLAKDLDRLKSIGPAYPMGQSEQIIASLQ